VLSEGHGLTETGREVSVAADSKQRRSPTTRRWTMWTLWRESEGEAAFASLDFSALFLEGLVHRHLFYWTWEMMTEMWKTAYSFKGQASFVGAFVKLRKATISFVMSVRLSVSMERLGSHWTQFHEIWYLSIFWKMVQKIQVSLKSHKNNRYFTWRPIYIFYHISPNSS
jgi:hypothetical protein